MTEAGAQRRPRNRKQLIVTAAAKQFEKRGFHDTAIADIAADVGITGSALYRHFRGKNELLVATIEGEMDQVHLAYQNSAGELRTLLENAAKATLRSDRASALWERNQAFVEEPHRAALAQRYLLAIEPLREAIGRARSDLRPDEVELLTWTTHAVFNSARAFEWAKLDRERGRALMADAAWAVASLPGPLPLGLVRARQAERRGRILPASRREAALATAVVLFAERGYQAVGMDEIGAAAGVSGPTLYHHFPGKSAILVTVIMRCLDSLYFDLSGVLARSDDPAEVLELVLASFVRVNVDQGDALGALTTEIVNVPELERVPIRRMQHDYVGEWVALLTRVRPELTAVEADALVRSTQSVMNTMRVHVPKGQQDPQALLRLLGRAILGLTPPPPAELADSA